MMDLTLVIVATTYVMIATNKFLILLLLVCSFAANSQNLSMVSLTIVDGHTISFAEVLSNQQPSFILFSKLVELEQISDEIQEQIQDYLPYGDQMVIILNDNLSTWQYVKPALAGLNFNHLVLIDTNNDLSRLLGINHSMPELHYYDPATGKITFINYSNILSLIKSNHN